jgi:hypothetical protein
LTGYLGGGGTKLNEYLRTPGVTLDERLEAQARTISAHLNNLEPISGQIRTFRGLAGDFAQGLKRGDLFTDRAFMSTSRQQGTSDEFIATGGTFNGRNTTGAGTRFVIDSEGAGRDVSKFTGLGEGEVLFDRNTPFEITGIQRFAVPMRVNGQDIAVRNVYMKTPGLETD